ncbi:MAG: hypothetical protein II337_03395, partial [Clostridia bacterium]|nr:hypothetical protein [Clostridia bacterium]
RSVKQKMSDAQTQACPSARGISETRKIQVVDAGFFDGRYLCGAKRAGLDRAPTAHGGRGKTLCRIQTIALSTVGRLVLRGEDSFASAVASAENIHFYEIEDGRGIFFPAAIAISVGLCYNI